MRPPVPFARHRLRSLLLLALSVAAGVAVGAWLPHATAAANDPRLIHSERSVYRDVLVYQDDEEHTRCLCFTRYCDIGRQSCLDLASPDRLVFEYTQMMLGALYLNPQPHTVLIIGLGGGTLPRTLEKLLPDAQIDVVEIDPAIVRVARDYFSFQGDARVHIIVQDGRAFARQALRGSKRYDLIMLDAYERQYIPEHMLTREFLQEVRGLLTPGGIVAANTFSSSRLYQNESVTYRAVFGPFYNLKSSNRVILAANGSLPPLSLVDRNAASLAQPFRAFGVSSQGVLELFSTTVDWNPRARVLTDQYSPANLLNGLPP
ncbi:MAG TPA: fused MFS/spermidine synthase [Steroidobacteraceae bacterium]|nr:fused MFS/spermidine synthase [Steroidobacteraceae bacterium]